jgi:hypothetical protein
MKYTTNYYTPCDGSRMKFSSYLYSFSVSQVVQFEFRDEEGVFR